MLFKSRRTEDLRKGRLSIPGDRYFLTWCTANRKPILAEFEIQTSARNALESLVSSGNGLSLAASIMPDHIHLLIELGLPLSISQIVGKLKSAITRAQAKVKWQENFFEHRLRPEKSVDDFAFYIFMNPYSADICPLDQTWPGWISSSKVHWDFETKLRPGRLPQPEWIEQAKRFGADLPRGAD